MSANPGSHHNSFVTWSSKLGGLVSLSVESEHWCTLEALWGLAEEHSQRWVTLINCAVSASSLPCGHCTTSIATAPFLRLLPHAIVLHGSMCPGVTLNRVWVFLFLKRRKHEVKAGQNWFTSWQSITSSSVYSSGNGSSCKVWSL